MRTKRWLRELKAQTRRCSEANLRRRRAFSYIGVMGVVAQAAARINMIRAAQGGDPAHKAIAIANEVLAAHAAVRQSFFRQGL